MGIIPFTLSVPVKETLKIIAQPAGFKQMRGSVNSNHFFNNKNRACNR